MTLRDLIQSIPMWHTKLDDEIKVDFHGELQSIERYERTENQIVLVIPVSSFERRYK